MLEDTINADRRPVAADGAEITGFKALSLAELIETYKTRNLPGIVSRTSTVTLRTTTP